MSLTAPMLAGLLFAFRDAEDRSDRLVATLPFAGSTLIEYQARLLLTAGVAQIVVVVGRLTPDLLGAIARIAKRGVTVDAVRNAGEAAEKLHPLSRVLVLADGLVTTETVVRELAPDGLDALLVLGDEEAGPGYERIGGRLAWAGAARLAQARLREVAALPRDYDLQSALLRAASQAGAANLLLPPGALGDGHGIEHRAAALETRGRIVLASLMSSARRWFDRWVVGPVSRSALPALIGRGVPTLAAIGAGAALGAVGLAAVHLGMTAAGSALCVAALLAWSVGSVLARLRDEDGAARALRVAGPMLAAAAALLAGERFHAADGDPFPLAVAVSLVAFGALGERAAHARAEALGWGSPGAYLLVLLAGSAADAPVAGLIAAAVYAAVTAGLAVETLRRHP